MSRRSQRRRKNRYAEPEDLNPMNYVSNLSDVMLILAVGIMIALLLHWNVKIDTPDSQSAPEENNAESNISFDGDDLESMDELPDNLEKMGDVFYDPVTGKYYIIEDKAD